VDPNDLEVDDSNLEVDGEIPEVVVTGFRTSLGAALQKKQRATGQVDAIVAEDIADFPDLNLAESLQRIPGVAITRANGEGAQITVRGLPGLYTRVRINGMEARGNVGNSTGGGGRSFDFNLFASELFKLDRGAQDALGQHRGRLPRRDGGPEHGARLQLQGGVDVRYGSHGHLQRPQRYGAAAPDGLGGVP
jgi:hypothetical protein